MTTESPQSQFTGPLPLHHTPLHYQHQQGHQGNLGTQSYGPSPVHSAQTTIDPYTRIAVLEKELEHCQTGKAEAEIALQCFAKLSAKGAANFGSGNQQVTRLELELAQAQKEKDAFEAKLENAFAIITTLLRSTTLRDIAPKSNKTQSKPNSFHVEDRTGVFKGNNKSTTSSNDATIVEQFQDNVSDDDAEAQDRGCNQYQLARQPVEFEDKPYIHHFTADEHDDPTCGDQSFKKDSQLPTSKSCGLIHANVSLDRISETSVEPNTDASSPEYATSSDGPASTSSSFVTANSGPHDSNIASAATMAEKADTIHALGVQRWNAAASAISIEDDTVLCPVLEFEGKKWSTLQDQKSSAVKPRKGKFSAAPSWEVYDLFSSPIHRERTLLHHQGEAGPCERKFPNLFKYGVRFEPEQDENNIYRTVVVQGLSPDTTLHQVLQKVRGGQVVNAKLLDTCSLLGSNSALVVFLHEHAAMAYEDYAEMGKLTINKREVDVKIVNTPTYPISVGLNKAVVDFHQTRCLEVHNYPRQVSEAQLRLDIRAGTQGKYSRVEHLKLRPDGCLELHFTNIEYAGQAFSVFSTFRIYKWCKTNFIPDPCAQPVESLKEACEAIPDSTIKQNGPLSARSPMENLPYPLHNDQKPQNPHSKENLHSGCDEASSLAINIRVESSDENYGRLEQPEEEAEPEHRRGRGFQGEESKVV